MLDKLLRLLGLRKPTGQMPMSYSRRRPLPPPGTDVTSGDVIFEWGKDGGRYSRGPTAEKVTGHPGMFLRKGFPPPPGKDEKN